MDTTSSFAPNVTAPRQPDLAPSTGTKARSKRKWSLAVVLVLVALLGSLAGTVLVARAGDRVSVLGIARDVQAGQKITDQDLTVVSFAEDPGLSPVSAAQRSSVVGQIAAVDLRRGGLLTRSQLTVGGGLGDDEQIVGIEVKRGYAPRDELRPGDKVAAVLLPGQGTSSATSGSKTSTQGTDLISVTVKSLSSPDASGSMVVNVAVAPADGPRLATMAAAKQVALIRQPREGN
ncbi:SAF domain-containing protein [Streptomyces mirabilis]|uniref:SAF domain-containing protein n=1 Tax=Streptomyces mirabilis TaxID=68239 RepID=A0ABU3V4V5_9ACTN|nr:SAF domain-containing protein [Streptomyces mirabilis]MCX5355563.1 SAF domain-containing protein [Streptomyces mirabilis]MDU9001209.1 SAF domain-containing protein [Streptomyces mirabilis]